MEKETEVSTNVNLSLNENDYQSLKQLSEGGAYALIAQLLQKQGSLEHIIQVASETLRITKPS